MDEMSELEFATLQALVRKHGADHVRDMAAYIAEAEAEDDRAALQSLAELEQARDDH